jgi:translation initiation factor IF-2
MNLRTLINADAQGIVIEARVDKRLGVVVTALVHKGELKIGDCVLLGSSWGRVRRLLTDQNVEVREAGPSVPIQVLLHISCYLFINFFISWVNFTCCIKIDNWC